MGGGLLQLVAYGAQDAYITGNPHITFWKVMYKRHTNFAMEAMRVNFTGSPAYGQRSVVVVNRNADLMFRTYLEVTLPDTRLSALGTTISGVTSTSTPSTSTAGVFWTAGGRRRLGYLLIQQVEIEIGGQVMDRHYGEWMYLWESLTSPFDQSIRLDQMLGKEVAGTVSTPSSCGGRPQVLYIPLSFWFCRNPGLALPLIALQYHEVRLNFIFRQATDLVQNIYGYDSNGNPLFWSGGIPTAAQNLPRFKDAAVYVDYIYLDTDERRRFAQQTHEYLIDQLQFGLQQSITSQTVRLDLTLNHPVKELVWVFQDARMLDCSQITNTVAGNGNLGQFGTAFNTLPFQYSDIVNRCRLQLNGQDRFDERYGDYFWKVQPYQHHSGGAFEPHALTQQPLQGAQPGGMIMTFTLTGTGSATPVTATAAAQAAGLLLTGGATYAQYVAAGSPPMTIIAALNLTTAAQNVGAAAAGLLVGTYVITLVLDPTTSTASACKITTKTGGAAIVIGAGNDALQITAMLEPNQAIIDSLASTTPLAGAGYLPNPSYAGTGASASYVPAQFNYAQAGFQQTNYGYTQSVNPINVYSFSLAPEEHQPSGSCNFSRIDTTTLVFDALTGNTAGALSAGQFPSKNYPYLFRMYAVNYNIFRVMSGMGGLAYSN